MRGAHVTTMARATLWSAYYKDGTATGERILQDGTAPFLSACYNDGTTTGGACYNDGTAT